MGRRVLEGAAKRRVADQELRVRLLAERHEDGVGQQDRVSTTEVALSGVTATESTCSSGARETSWIESTAPSEETQSRGRMRSRSALRAYSIEEIGREVDLAGEEPRVQLGRDAGDLLDLDVEPVEDRRHVHVADAAETDHCVIPAGRR